jgi:hypothetical protein
VNGVVRADQIGSLLRPATLLDARDEFHAGRLTLEQLRSIEDTCIEQALQMQRDQLALSTQCGFQGSGTRDGRHVSMDAERQKLELVVDVARQIWP